MQYRERLADQELQQRLKSAGGVLIEGPRACGKTETARRAAGSEVLLDIDTAARQAANLDPILVLTGRTPRLIDEWQVVPSIWNAVRRNIDSRHMDGQFILTGSATPADDLTRHTGGGRISRLRMRTMSLAETGHSTGQIQMSHLLNGDFESAASPRIRIDDLIEVMCRGGWPGNLQRSLANAQRGVRDYLEEIVRADINIVGGVQRDPERVRALFHAVARNIATEVTLTTLAKDSRLHTDTETMIQKETIAQYLKSLERLMILEPQPAWAPHLRSRSLVRSIPKQHFVDPSLAIAALRVRPADLLADINFLGFVFESLVIRDLRCYAQASDAVVRHYRDNTGLEVDAIVDAGNNRWAAFEVKLGAGEDVVDRAAAQLLKFAHRVDTKKCGEPTTLAVIVGLGEYAYRRRDGVAVIPVTALGA